MPPLLDLALLVVLGLAAGVLGGLLGIGGSVIMIPVLTLALRYDFHVAQAAAMVVNVFVAFPAALRHRRAGAIEGSHFRRMLPAGLVMIVVGVELSNRMDGRVLELGFGAFLVYVVAMNARRLLRGGEAHDEDPAAARPTWARLSLVGALTGLAAGLLGIGGGVLAVPLLQRLVRLPLRRCIALSAGVMVVTAAIGALRKNLALGDIPDLADDALRTSLVTAACLAPSAMIGGALGAGLTHRLPLRAIRAVLVVLLALAAWRFLAHGASLLAPHADDSRTDAPDR